MINEVMSTLEKYSKPVLRIGISLVFLFFGSQQLTNNSSWQGFVPDFALILGLTAEKIVMFNSIFELSFGLLLLFGIYTRIVALFLSIHLFIISFSLGFNDLGMRDFGLAIATFVVFMNGNDNLSLGNIFTKKHKSL